MKQNNFKSILLAYLVFLLINPNIMLSAWFNEEIDYGNNFIHRDILLEHANFIFDPTISLTNSRISDNPKSFDPAKVKHGDIIFIRKPHLFFKTIHPRIKHPYNIVTTGHFTDAFKNQYLKYFDSKIIAWFAIHTLIKPQNKLHAIPLGIIPLSTIPEQRIFYASFFKKLRSEIPKNNWLYLNVKASTHPVRSKVKNHFTNKSFCFIRDQKIAFHDYLEEMASFKFTLCPPGKGPDTYRTWEALMVGSIPIVQSSTLNELYKDLPVVIINDWEKITPSFLEQEYAKIMVKKKSYKFEKLFVEYWINKIKTKHKNVCSSPIDEPSVLIPALSLPQ